MKIKHATHNNNSHKHTFKHTNIKTYNPAKRTNDKSNDAEAQGKKGLGLRFDTKERLRYE